VRGAIRSAEKHALLLKSFAHGPASDPRAHLVLVGEGELRANLEEQAKKLNVAEKVHFLGLRSDIPDVWERWMRLF